MTGTDEAMPRILVIDDEQGVRELLRDVLERAGYEVMDAPNGHAGIALHQQHPADLIVTDMIMPEQEGIETILQLRREFPSVKILAMSGGGHSGNLQPLRDAMRLGAAGTLSKPFRPREILAAVREVLAQEG